MSATWVIIPDPNAQMGQKEQAQEEPQDPNAPMPGDMDLSGDLQAQMPIDPQALAAAGAPI